MRREIFGRRRRGVRRAAKGGGAEVRSRRSRDDGTVFKKKRVLPTFGRTGGTRERLRSSFTIHILEIWKQKIPSRNATEKVVFGVILFRS